MRILLPVMAVTLAACQSEHQYGGFHDLQTRGMLGVPSSAAVVGNGIAADAEVDHVGGAKLLVDTGAPLTLIAPDSYPAANVPLTAKKVDSLTVGGLEIEGAPVLLVSVTNGQLPFTLGGILGADVFCQFTTSFNYRDQQVALGAGPPPAGVGDDVVAPFAIEGGGPIAGTTLVLSPTRIVLPVMVEGASYTFMVDSGASYAIVSPELFAHLSADGRGVLAGLPIGTVGGQVNGTATRLHSLAVGGATVNDLPALTIDGPQLPTISNEVGMTLDGLVGGTFLREFYVTIDYHERLLHLRRYATRDHIHDDFVRLGFTLQATAGGYQVQLVHPNTDAAAQQLAGGDEVLAIDGQQLAGLDLVSASALLMGTAGQLKRVRLGMTAVPATLNQTLQIRVEDLLPY